MKVLWPDFILTSDQTRWSGVIDMNLLLSQYGLVLLKTLETAVDLWLPREIWHLLEDLDGEQSWPQTQPMAQTAQLSVGATSTIEWLRQGSRTQRLQAWSQLWMSTHPNALNLFWVGDRLSESFLPEQADPQLMDRWEVLAASLDTRLAPHSVNSPLAAIYRDTTALAAALESAFILTCQSSTSATASEPPELCVALANWGIPCQQIDGQDPIVAIERDYLRRILISTGTAKFLWAGLKLIILHLIVPASSTLGLSVHLPKRDSLQSTGNDVNLQTNREEPIIADTLWEGAQGFWYVI
jgi:hypothetical protein